MQRKIHDFFALQKPSDLRYVTAAGLVGWLSRSSPVLVVDVRFPYEYAGGHIQGACNAPDPIALWDVVKDWDGSLPIVLHCEFSQKRGPMMGRWLRSTDRQNNLENYPMLTYPSLYILAGGYSQFYAAYPDYCEPRGYVAMDTAEFKTEKRSCCHHLKKLFKRYNY
jgi:M-phase inducer tyrosine phosphatase